MKRIESLDEKLKHFDEAVGQAVGQNMPTFRRMFLNALGGGKADSGEEAITMFDLGIKIKNAGPAIDIEDSDFNILKGKCLSNPLGWQAHFLAQVIIKLNEAEAVK